MRERTYDIVGSHRNIYLIKKNICLYILGTFYQIPKSIISHKRPEV